jgi:hypothetical protein
VVYVERACYIDISLNGTSISSVSGTCDSRATQTAPHLSMVKWCYRASVRLVNFTCRFINLLEKL